MIISAVLSSVLAWVLYKDHPETVSVWGFPSTIAGDLAITTIILWLMTWFIGTGLGIRDMTLRYPVAVTRDSMPKSWTHALYCAPMLVPIPCFGKHKQREDKQSRHKFSLASLFRWSLGHSSPLCLPRIDTGNHPELKQKILENLGIVQKAPGEPMSACCTLPGLKHEFCAVWPLIVATELLVAIPLSALLTIRGTEEGIWSLTDLIILKGLYGSIMSIPSAWIVCISVMLWYERRRTMMLAEGQRNNEP